jgi:protein SCO1/2
MLMRMGFSLTRVVNRGICLPSIAQFLHRLLESHPSRRLGQLVTPVRCGLLLATLGIALPAIQAGAVTPATVKKHAAASKTTPKSTPQPRSAAADYNPNVLLRTQDDRPVHFYDDIIKGKVVLINFMFTTCTSICPPMTANLFKVQELLKAELGKQVHMVSISVDPETDTPVVLKEYAQRFSARPGWFFLTGAKADIEAVVAKMGDTSRDKLKHSGMLLIGNDPAKQWQKGFAMAPPEEIVATVKRMLEKPAAPPEPPPIPPPPPPT